MFFSISNDIIVVISVIIVVIQPVTSKNKNFTKKSKEIENETRNNVKQQLQLAVGGNFECGQKSQTNIVCVESG